jgi:hypothetical protein
LSTSGSGPVSTPNVARFGEVRRERELGENPGLSRSGMQERPPSSALARRKLRLGSDGQ